MFWHHILLNKWSNELRRSKEKIFEFTEWEHMLWKITAAHCAPSGEEEPEGFSRWLKNQLREDAPFFTRVQPVVDEYLSTTVYAQQLLDQNSNPEVFKKLKEAGYVTYTLLLPIYKEAEEQQRRDQEERTKREARETEFCENEERRLTAQRVAIAVKDETPFGRGGVFIVRFILCSSAILRI